MKTKTPILVKAALFAALTCVATMILKIPSPLKGYINLGDCMVLLSGWILPPGYGFLAAGLGSALADLFSGYVIYAPATFIIKGSMAIAAFFIFSMLHKTSNTLIPRVISGIFAEIIMVLGYYLFEGFLYGFAPSVVNIPANMIQGAVGLLLGIVLMKSYVSRNPS